MPGHQWCHRCPMRCGGRAGALEVSSLFYENASTKVCKVLHRVLPDGLYNDIKIKKFLSSVRSVHLFVIFVGVNDHNELNSQELRRWVQFVWFNVEV